MKHLLKMSDLTPAELYHILDVADQLKAAQKAGSTPPLLAGKSVALMFSKTSTRTRTSFEVGVYQMGGLGSYMNAVTELQAGRGEPLKDTARVLGRYYDCIVWRTYRQRDLEELAEYAGVPVINGLTDYAHPCQVLADLMTIRERYGSLAGRKLCFVGDGNNMANSLIAGGLMAGMQVTCVCPRTYRPAADVLAFARPYGDSFEQLEDPAPGFKDADVVVTAVWNNAANEAEAERRMREFLGYQLTGSLLENAKPGCMVLHCLPAHRGEEISNAVFEAHAQEIFDEAENRLPAKRAVLPTWLGAKYPPAVMKEKTRFCRGDGRTGFCYNIKAKSHREQYSSGRRGVTRNLVGRVTGARVQIPAAPPNRGNRWTFRSSVPSFFVWSTLPGAASSAGKPLRLVFRHTKMDDDGRINRVLAPVDACRPKQYNRSKWNPIGQSRKG